MSSRRATLQKNSDIQPLAKFIIQGIKKANLHAPLNKLNFSATDLLDAASCTYHSSLRIFEKAREVFTYVTTTLHQR
jgi:hypothetical protein